MRVASYKSYPCEVQRCSKHDEPYVLSGCLPFTCKSPKASVGDGYQVLLGLELSEFLGCRFCFCGPTNGVAFLRAALKKMIHPPWFNVSRRFRTRAALAPTCAMILGFSYDHQNKEG